MDFTEINSRGKRGELLGRTDRQNSRFQTAKAIRIKFDLHASFVELESAKNAVNEEDFAKRKITGKRARRHFSQFSEFERGLIIGMKTAGWSTRHVTDQVDSSECAVRNVGSSGHEKVPTRGKPGLERPARP
ncbi:hypothetical protein TNCV_1081091 [Trichonephila clavipes]|uniref:Transposase IS30-like HTH domain-containing protein n=1 Tax=Trichonephila clavipes TaxID=2585209 RepID=A0A8X6RZT2_TRICX|nr:hypothetical protein TNCV_1081091 [Trichonephila clavipes]